MAYRLVEQIVSGLLSQSAAGRFINAPRNYGFAFAFPVMRAGSPQNLCARETNANHSHAITSYGGATCPRAAPTFSSSLPFPRVSTDTRLRTVIALYEIHTRHWREFTSSWLSFVFMLIRQKIANRRFSLECVHWTAQSSVNFLCNSCNLFVRSDTTWYRFWCIPLYSVR